MADGGVDVAVGVVAQQPPHAAVRSESHWALFLRGVEEEGDDSVARDVSGDVLLSVVGPHLLLVDILLEDVAEHVGVDLVVLPVRPLVQVPAVAIEEVEDPLEGGVGDGDVGVVALQVVNVEQAAVEKGDPAEEGSQIGRALSFRLPQTFVEQPQKEEAVELLEATAAAVLLHHLQAVAQVVDVLVEEALLLDEIDEHHAVEHEGGVPVAAALGGDALNELPEGCQLGPEPFVEVLGDLLHVQCGPDPRTLRGRCSAMALHPGRRIAAEGVGAGGLRLHP